MERHAHNPEGLVDAPSIGYSHAVVAGDTLSVSGQVGWDAEFEVAGADVESQTRQAIQNVETLLADVGADLDDVTKVTAHVVDLPDNREDFFAAWSEVFPEPPYPCLTLLGPAHLAQEDLLVEIEVEVPAAAVDDESRAS